MCGPLWPSGNLSVNPWLAGDLGSSRASAALLDADRREAAGQEQCSEGNKWAPDQRKKAAQDQGQRYQEKEGVQFGMH